MILVRNKRASYDYELADKFTAGLVLSGQEVKSLKAGQASLYGSFIDIAGGEAWLINAFIAPYQNQRNDEQTRRRRKLLLKPAELAVLRAVRQQGKHIIPLHFKTLRGFIKLDVAVGKARQKADRRDYLKAREDKRQANVIVRKHNRFSTG